MTAQRWDVTAAPFAFTGDLAKVVVTIEDTQGDAEGAAQALLARE